MSNITANDIYSLTNGGFIRFSQSGSSTIESESSIINSKISNV